MSQKNNIESCLESLADQANDLEELDRILAGFNAFEVLRIARTEIRHSNVLAWLLDSGESHGLGCEFAIRWFDEISSNVIAQAFQNPLELRKCSEPRVTLRARREWGGQNPQGRKADLLVEVFHGQRMVAVICIENKIGHVQTENQLKDYREMVENCYRQVTSKYYFFLTSSPEDPDDPAFVSVSYRSICGALEDILNPDCSLQSGTPEVRAFLTQYNELLHRYFMNDSQEMRLALEIYRKHRRAIDYILEIRPDHRSELTRLVLERISAEAKKLKIVLLRADPSRGLIRFAPETWGIDSNRAKDANDWWHTFCQIEICKGSSTPMLIGTVFPHDDSGKILPRASALHSAAQEVQFPHSTQDAIGNDWYAFFRVGADNISIENLQAADLEPLADHIFLWVKETIHSKGFSKMAEVTAEILIEAR